MHEIAFFGIWILAGFITGVSGLGAGMVAVPLLSFFMDPHTIIPVSSCLVSVLCLELGLIYRKNILYIQIKDMIIGSIPGLIIGIYILIIIPAHLLLLSIGIIMVTFVLWQFTRKLPKYSQKATTAKAMLAGFISGILSTSVSFGGPPCAIYAIHTGWSHKETLANINIFVGLSSFLGVISYYIAGLLTKEILIWSLLGIPAVSLGILISLPISRFINIYFFRIILLIVIGLGGFSCIIKSFF